MTTVPRWEKEEKPTEKGECDSKRAKEHEEKGSFLEARRVSGGTLASVVSDAKERLRVRETEKRNLNDLGANAFRKVRGQSQAAVRY